MKNVVLLLLLIVVSLLVLLAFDAVLLFFASARLRIAVQLVHSLEEPPT